MVKKEPKQNIATAFLFVINDYVGNARRNVAFCFMKIKVSVQNKYRL